MRRTRIRRTKEEGKGERGEEKYICDDSNL